MERLSRTDETQQNAIKVLRYYAYFHYPLTAQEVFRFFPVPESPSAVEQSLAELVSQKAVFRFGDYYSLENNKQLVDRRIRGNELARKRQAQARRVGRFISRFPFVGGVYISGSLSKNYADEHTDLDFFICTQPGKVWISRTLLHLFKKLTFLVGKQHDFCMNYFIDADHLRIEEQNIYTATELVTLMAVRENDRLLPYLLEQNSWIAQYLPNAKPVYESNAQQLFMIPERGHGFSRRLFDGLNRALMNLTDHYWKRKWKRRGFPESEYPLAFKTREFVSKNHPQNYQKKMLEYCKQIGLHA